jgi:acetyl-CoA synthetase
VSAKGACLVAASATKKLEATRDFLFRHRSDYQAARRGFRWPEFEYFNFAFDWFDVIGRERDRAALLVSGDDGSMQSRTFSELSAASNRIANFLQEAGVRRDDTVLLMLGNVASLWESMLAIMKLGAVMIPAAPLLSANDLADRIERGNVRCVIADHRYTARFTGGGWTGISVGGAASGWLRLEDSSAASGSFEPAVRTRATDPLLLYFTSGTTAKPKLVLHSHMSYPVGHLSTLYWIGLMRGDRHLNISSAGWAKHAWSCFFAPWLAEATIVVLDHARFDAVKTLDVISNQGVTTFCAPPTVWRVLIQHDLARWKVALRELVGAGEPLNPEIIERVRQAWGITVRDGFGQTESSVMLANTPGQPVVAGKLGRPLPGFEIHLLDSDGQEATEGQIAVSLTPRRPTGLMQGYQTGARIQPLSGDFYLTGDVASKDEDGNFTYVGRADDVFKSSDYRISPFELESVLIRHPLVAEAAVIPSPDPVRLAVPKAFVALVAGAAADADSAQSILDHARAELGPFKRIRKIEFFELPKTISGKIRRVELRRLEAERCMRQQRGELEWREEDFLSAASSSQPG